jgi:hypothetical protein
MHRIAFGSTGDCPILDQVNIQLAFLSPKNQLCRVTDCLKLINALQAKTLHIYKNTKGKLHRNNAAICFNKILRLNYLTPSYINYIEHSSYTWINKKSISVFYILLHILNHIVKLSILHFVHWFKTLVIFPL